MQLKDYIDSSTSKDQKLPEQDQNTGDSSDNQKNEAKPICTKFDEVSEAKSEPKDY